jgi:RNA polymerase sigma-70 factor (ECF subfamily)
MPRGTGRASADNPPSGAQAASDIILMVAIAARDDSALATLYDRYSVIVFAQCLRALSRPAAEEVVIEVFWELWEKADRFDPSRGTAAAYILGVSRSRIIDKLRADGARKWQSDPASPEDRAGSPNSTPLDDMVTNEQRTRVCDALAKLTPAERNLVDLAYFDALSQSEIAQRLSQPFGTVKSQIRKAIARLRDLLSDK